MQKDQRRKICRYYARGKCVKQDCPFVHQQQTKKPCTFYTQTGFCRKGKNCQFYHATKQQQKKTKAFVQKTKQVKKNSENTSVMSGLVDDYIDHKATQQKNKQQQKISSAADDLLALKLSEQHYQQLTKHQSTQPPLQFLKSYPKSFPDHRKLPQTISHVKQIQSLIFQSKPFLSFISQIQKPQQKQYYQIVRRFQETFQLVDEIERKVYFIRLRPLLYDKEVVLHFAMEEDRVEIRVDQRGYPEARATFQILNKTIPLGYKNKFTQLLHKFHAKNSLFDTLKYFQNHFEKCYQTVKSRLQDQHFKKLELKRKIESQRQRIMLKQKHQRKQAHRKQKQQKKQQKQEKQQRQQQQIQEKQQQMPQLLCRPSRQAPPKPSQKIIKQYRDYIQLQFSALQKPQHQNLNDCITLQSLQMQNCPYLVLQKLLLYIECNCSKVHMYLFDALERKQLKLWVKLRCRKCSGEMRIVWQREVVQVKAQQVCAMSIVNGKIVDVGGLGWKVGCECDQEIFKNKLYLPGEKLQLNCHACFQNMTIMYNGIKFHNPFVKEFQMQEDKQLPLKGACNHQKYNFKWMRYACCGRPFACDQCHDLGSIKKHQILQGITIVCGFCAYEQNVSNQCIKCKKQLLRGVDKAGHWEGGMGCRDQTLLSKKDGKKYAGLSKKEPGNKKKQK